MDDLLSALGMTNEELTEFSQDGNSIGGSIPVEELMTLLGTYKEALPLWTEAANRGMQEQAASDAPAAAAQLNAQLVATFGTYAVAFESVDETLAQIESGATSPSLFDAIAEAEAAGSTQTAKAIGLARRLKKECGLFTSGEFFDAGCYGDESLQWYLRTNARIGDVTALSGGPESVGATAEIRSRQERDEPPLPLHDLQVIYLSAYDLIASANAGDLELTQLELEVTLLETNLDSEKARLDIACDGSGNGQNLSLAHANEILNSEPQSVGDSEESISGGLAGEPAELDRILATCAGSPLYPVGTIITTQSEGFLATIDGRYLLVTGGRELRITGPFIERGACDAWPVEVVGAPSHSINCYIRECASPGDAGMVSEVVFQADADQT